jgi:hypothetical protein
MNIQTVAENLRNTIAGKEELLADLKGRRIPPEVSIHYLEININELKRILEDVEQCVYIDRYHEGYDAGWEQAILKERG